VENFWRSNKRHLRTTIHHTITTNSPANYHQKTYDFPEPPSKTPAKQQKKLATQPSDFFAKFECKKIVRASVDEAAHADVHDDAESEKGEEDR
jgi:hypothetical protein